ncbi:DUF6545 domain-containing protein [Streptomyces mirabilis]|uniref:DUF6545 domain-containing protein n=1 Tax=Streptomyces mirabilis TaxID=68239 RepID=UPI0021BF1980|nr:DUF6545 domain-containing protein [Streptomyces mirabilis]MCT9105248.1 hypothetical protein [Streptomyces mirabilis]
MTKAFLGIAAVLAIGLLYKLPAVLRGGRNPLARQVAGLLVLACCVFVFAAPSSIARMNDLTGITNFSAPWVYSLITGFCASCLLLIVKWRGGQSIRRANWWVYGSYGTLLTAIWACFFLSDHHVERVRDLDTYYANTPWMREMIVLYLLGHTVAVLITSVLLWTWEPRVRGTGWLHAGVILLSIGYALNLAFDVAKFTPVIARWNGRSDLNWMSTQLAPPIATLVGLLIALGFIVPHAGEQMAQRWASCTEYWALSALNRALNNVPTASAPVALGRFASLELRLTFRKTFIRDALRLLQPCLDFAWRDRIMEAHLSRGKSSAEAKALADATAVLAAVARMAQNKTPQSAVQTQRPPAEDLGDLVAISRALRKIRSTDAVRGNAAHQESVTP